MRVVLALEASSREYVVAVGAAEEPRVQRASRRDAPGFAGLGDMVVRAVAAAGATFRDIAVIAVDVGPGGLSSIRSAVAYANGLAFSLGSKIFPVTSLELMAIAAGKSHQGPFLSLKRGQGGSTYAGLFAGGEAREMRHGPLSSVVPAMAGGLDRVCVTGVDPAGVAAVLPGVTVEDAGVAGADVVTLYQAARGALADPARLVSLASPVNEASKIFHEPVPSRRQRAR